MPCHIHHIVSTAHDHEVAVGVLNGHVTGEIAAWNSAPVVFIAFWITVDGAEKVREGMLEYQEPTLPGSHGVPLLVHDIGDNARERFAHLPRSRIDADRRAQARATRFRLPTVIGHIDPGTSPHQVLMRPAPGFRIQGLASAGEITQTG